MAKLQDEESSQALKAKTLAIGRVFHMFFTGLSFAFGICFCKTTRFIAETVFPLDLPMIFSIFC